MTEARGYETFDHTADIGIRAWGNEFTEVFEEAAKALFSVIADLNSVTPTETLALELTAENGEELFLKWLKELLYIFETQHLLLKDFKVCLNEGRGSGQSEGVHLKAELSGELLNNKKHVLGREVKAITHHQFKLAHEKARYLAEVILDI